MCRDTHSHVCPQTWLNQARKDKSLFLTTCMGFLNVSDSLAYSAILGELLSGLSVRSVGLSKIFGFLLLLVGFFMEPGSTYLAIS